MREVKLYYDDEATPGDYEWVAEMKMYEGDEAGVHGWGHTPEAALANLRRYLEEL